MRDQRVVRSRLVTVRFRWDFLSLLAALASLVSGVCMLDIDDRGVLQCGSLRSKTIYLYRIEVPGSFVVG